MCIRDRAKAELEANGVTLADYDSILDGMAAEIEPQTVLAESETKSLPKSVVSKQGILIDVDAGTILDGKDALKRMVPASKMCIRDRRKGSIKKHGEVVLEQ